MMQIPAFRYLRWFKERIPRARISLASSGMEEPSEALLPLHRLSWRLDIQDVGGYHPLEEAVASHLGVPADRVVVVPGCTYATHAATRALVRPGDAVCVESPTYELLVRVAEVCGAQVKRIPRPTDADFDLPMERLSETFAQGVTTLMLTVPHNPSLRMLDELQVAELAALAEGHDVRILVDEVYLDFFAAPLRSYRSLSAVSDRFVTTGSLTKVHGLGNLRVGWVAGPPDVIEGVRRFHDLLADRVAAFDAQAALMAFDRMDALIAHARAVREQNWPLMKQWADAIPGIGLVDPGGGITAVLRIPEEIDSLALAEGLFERDGILVAPAEMFGARGFVRVSYGIPHDRLLEGLAGLQRALVRATERV